MADAKLNAIKLSCVTPFGDRDLILDQAGAILMLLANAYEADSEANDLAARTGRSAPDWSGLNPHLFHDALEGVASLIAVARHLENEGV